MVCFCGYFSAVNIKPCTRLDHANLVINYLQHILKCFVQITNSTKCTHVCTVYILLIFSVHVYYIHVYYYMSTIWHMAMNTAVYSF